MRPTRLVEPILQRGPWKGLSKYCIQLQYHWVFPARIAGQGGPPLDFCRQRSQVRGVCNMSKNATPGVAESAQGWGKIAALVTTTGVGKTAPRDTVYFREDQTERGSRCHSFEAWSLAPGMPVTTGESFDQFGILLGWTISGPGACLAVSF